jgi:hypothetical protein
VDIDVIIARERRRRHRLRSGAVIGAAVSVAVVAGLPPLLGAVDTPQVATRRADLPFPDYLAGKRIIGQVSVPLAQQEVVLAFTPSVPQTELTLFAYCEIPGDEETEVELRVQTGPGTWYVRDTCGDLHSIMPSPGWPTFAEPGERSTVRLTLAGLSGPAPAGIMAVGVGEPVPPEEYPFPTPPPSLAPLAEPSAPAPQPGGERVELTADAADHAAPRRASVRWDELTILFVWSQTPGTFRVEVDGRPARRATVWSYDQQPAVINLADPSRWEAGVPMPEPGDTVAVTVVADDITGEWNAVVVTNPTVD